MKGKDEWKQIRDFFRDYVDKSYSNKQNTIRLSRANTREHNMRVCEVCMALLEADIPFYTEVKLNCGLRPDVVTPTHVVKCIEVMHTETPFKFITKKQDKLPEGLKEEFIFINTAESFSPSDVL